jgi:hypothetical protein
MDAVLVIDTSSLINFTKFYYFDKYNEQIVYKNIINFLINKIKERKIIVIDKVYNEWRRNRYNEDIRDEIEDDVFTTESLIPKVQDLINNYQNQENIRLLGWTEQQIEVELNDYESGKIADLYLIACCLKLKEDGKKPILITGETRSNDGKIIEKIPTICISKRIEYRNIPYALFEIYKNELKFELSIN